MSLSSWCTCSLCSAEKCERVWGDIFTAPPILQGNAALPLMQWDRETQISRSSRPLARVERVTKRGGRAHYVRRKNGSEDHSYARHSHAARDRKTCTNDPQERRSASLINMDVRLRSNQLLLQIANNGQHSNSSFCLQPRFFRLPEWDGQY